VAALLPCFSCRSDSFSLGTPSLIGELDAPQRENLIERRQLSMLGSPSRDYS